MISDLETLKEVNEELEEQFVENEKFLQKEIERRDAAVKDLNGAVDQLRETNADCESTITRFRSLVTSLQRFFAF